MANLTASQLSCRFPAPRNLPLLPVINAIPAASQDEPAFDMIVRIMTGAGCFLARPLPLRRVRVKGKTRRCWCKNRPAKHAAFLCNTLNHPEHSS